MARPKSITLRKRTFAHLKGPRWEVDCGWIDAQQPDGTMKRERLRRFFSKKQDAEIWRDEQRDKLKRHGETSVGLSEVDRILFQNARDRLARAGATIDKAVEYYLQHHKPIREPLTLAKLLDKAVVDKELTGAVSERYLKQFRSSCGLFVRGRENRLAHEVTRDEVKAWVLGNGWAPRTQRGYLGDLRSLFSWAVQERYLAVNPIAGEEGFIQLEEMPDEEISCFDVESCEALLQALLFARYDRWIKKKVVVSANYHELIGYVALTMFAGVRPDEARKIPLQYINTRERTLVVLAAGAKTRKRRVIELQRVAVVWLRLWQRLCPGCPVKPKNFDRRWKALRKAAGLKQWPSDILRHSFASYHYAAYGSTALLQSQLGHSEDEDTLFHNYRAVLTLSQKPVTKKAGERFLALTPRRVRLAWLEKKAKISVASSTAMP